MDTIFHINRNDNFSCKGVSLGKSFRVFAGSSFRERSADNLQKYGKHYFELRKKLVHDGVVQKIDGQMIFTKDYDFSYISEAASIVLGQHRSGEPWKTKQGMSYPDWDNGGIDKATKKNRQKRGYSSRCEITHDEIANDVGEVDSPEKIAKDIDSRRDGLKKGGSIKRFARPDMDTVSDIRNKNGTLSKKFINKCEATKWCDQTGLSFKSKGIFKKSHDHIIPVCHGGSDMIDNIQFVVNGFNQLKGSYDEEQASVIAVSMVVKLGLSNSVLDEWLKDKLCKFNLSHIVFDRGSNGV